jgi:mono/diheme cytochrome c family protein
MKHPLLTLLVVIQFVTVSNIAGAQDEDARPVANSQSQQPVSFERDVLPLLEKRCNKCHQPDEAQGGLDLTRRATMLRGGDELGAAIVPDDPQMSPLIQVLTGKAEPAMPSEGDPLPTTEIELLRRWILAGANDDTPQFSRQDIDFFEREIRPVLFTQCFKCHAGDEAESGLRLTSRHGILAGGSRGPAVTTGDPDSSLILKAIRHDGELQMPKRGDPLSSAQVAAFAEWIKRGLPWPRDEAVLARDKLFTISKSDRNHWAFRPLPRTLPEDWSIDRVLRSRHQAAGLEPVPEADRHRLLRRVTYDLIGYPPTPDETHDFVHDDSSDAFEKVVKTLLASPQFGWRWGRHWLDYTRNGANGLPNRGPAFESDRYAAWVTKCFNEDRPYDWFARVHLAGDRMPGFDGADYSIDQALAATVPLNGPRTFQEMSTDTFVLMDKLDESVEFMGRSLMGISLECARCHDHKFDPISQHDYYGLLGFFQSSSFGPVPANAKTHAGAEAAVARQRELLREQARLSGLIRKASIKLNVGGGGRTRKWEAARQAVLAPKEKRLLEIELAILTAELEEAERLRMKKLVDDLEETLKVTTGGVERIQTATLLRRLNQRAGLLHSRSQIGTRPDQASDGCRPDRTRTGDPEAGSVLDGRDGTVSRATTLRWICKVGS